MWIVGLLPPDGSSPVPESVRVAFRSFSDIRNPGSYTAPDESWLPHHKVQSSGTPRFNFTEWWNIREGEILGEPFDIRDELPNVLVGFLERVCTLLLLPIP